MVWTIAFYLGTLHFYTDVYFAKAMLQMVSPIILTTCYRFHVVTLSCFVCTYLPKHQYPSTLYLVCTISHYTFSFQFPLPAVNMVLSSSVNVTHTVKSVLPGEDHCKVIGRRDQPTKKVYIVST